MWLDFFFKQRPQQKLPLQTDIHCHLVPGVDDGSPDLQTSIQLLGHMADWGFERIFVSPHSTQDKFENTPESLAGPFESLRQVAAPMNIGLDYHLEYRIDEFFLDQLEQGNIRTLPNNYILIENAFSHEPWGLDSIVYDLLNKGYKPILAHPERYKYYSKHHKHRYNELHDLGLYFQINLLSLAGYYGSLERQTALYLLENKWVQFLGTDLHRLNYVPSIDQYLRSRQYLRDLPLINNLHNDEAF